MAVLRLNIEIAPCKNKSLRLSSPSVRSICPKRYYCRHNKGAEPCPVASPSVTNLIHGIWPCQSPSRRLPAKGGGGVQTVEVFVTLLISAHLRRSPPIAEVPMPEQQPALTLTRLGFAEDDSHVLAQGGPTLAVTLPPDASDWWC